MSKPSQSRDCLLLTCEHGGNRIPPPYAHLFRVVHVAVHSFTPKLDGKVRNADLTLLYDSRRTQEAALCRRWGAILRRLNPGLRLRYNYPYRGAADGLTTWLRRRHSQQSYLGVELEINQALVQTRGWRRFQQQIASSLGELLVRP
jgi:predicted N-formylglutamate amidohydrolase